MGEFPYTVFGQWMGRDTTHINSCVFIDTRVLDGDNSTCPNAQTTSLHTGGCQMSSWFAGCLIWRRFPIRDPLGRWKKVQGKFYMGELTPLAVFSYIEQPVNVT